GALDGLEKRIGAGSVGSLCRKARGQKQGDRVKAHSFYKLPFRRANINRWSGILWAAMANPITRRSLGLTAAAALSRTADAQAPTAPAAGPGPDEPHAGNLYPFIQRQADSAPLSLSFLRPEFRSPGKWQKQARARIFDRLSYAPAA